MHIKKIVVSGVALVVGLVLMASAAGSASPATVLKADTLAGVSGPYVGSANPIRGVNGGGVAWNIAKGKASSPRTGPWRSRWKVSCWRRRVRIR